jgi:hypothetical protein
MGNFFSLPIFSLPIKEAGLKAPKEGMPESSYASQAPSQEKVAHRVSYGVVVTVVVPKPT